MTLPKISVVVIGHNEEAQLEACIQSILDAEYPAEQKEIIYVDNHSTDGSLDKAARLPIRILAVKEDPPYPGVARNAGLRVATGEYIQFVDGDMQMDPSWLRRALPYFQWGSIACVVGRLKERHPEASVFNGVLDLSWKLKELGAVTSPAGGGLFRRDVLERVGGYDESLRAGEEIDLGYKLRKAHYQIYSIDAPMATHDADIHSLRQFWARSFRDGYAEMQIILKQFQWGRPLPQDYIWKMNSQVGLFALLGTTILCTHQWLWAIPLISVPVLLVARKTLRYGYQTGLWKWSFLYSFFLYLNMIPLTVGEAYCLWDRARSRWRPEKALAGTSYSGRG